MTEIKGEYTKCKMHGDVFYSKVRWICNHAEGEIETETDNDDLFIATATYEDGSKERIEIKKTEDKDKND